MRRREIEPDARDTVATAVLHRWVRGDVHVGELLAQREVSGRRPDAYIPSLIAGSGSPVPSALPKGGRLRLAPLGYLTRYSSPLGSFE